PLVAERRLRGLQPEAPPHLRRERVAQPVRAPPRDPRLRAGRADRPGVAGAGVAGARGLARRFLGAAPGLARRTRRTAAAPTLGVEVGPRLPRLEQVLRRVRAQPGPEDGLAPGADGDDPVLAAPRRLVSPVPTPVAAGPVEPDGV